MSVTMYPPFERDPRQVILGLDFKAWEHPVRPELDAYRRPMAGLLLAAVPRLAARYAAGVVDASRIAYVVNNMARRAHDHGIAPLLPADERRLIEREKEDTYGQGQ